MWGGVSQLDLPYEVRHMMRFKDKHQRPLTEREKEIIRDVRAQSKPNPRYGFVVPNLKAINKYDLTAREKRVIWDEVKGLKGNDRALRPPVGANDDYKKPPKYTYLDLLRCGGKTHRLAAKKKKEKPKAKYRCCDVNNM